LLLLGELVLAEEEDRLSIEDHREQEWDETVGEEGDCDRLTLRSFRSLDKDKLGEQLCLVGCDDSSSLMIGVNNGGKSTRRSSILVIDTCSSVICSFTKYSS
jgi:hypothetical protein